MAGSDREKMKIRFVKGDATAPKGEGNKVIVHICNDLGKWGKGFVLAISKRWPQPEIDYKLAFSKASGGLALGDVQFVNVSKDTTVANIIGQHGIISRGGRGKSKPPIRYSAVRHGLEKVADYAHLKKASVHMPRIGCGLAGGEWSKIETIVKDVLCDSHIEVTVYDFP